MITRVKLPKISANIEEAAVTAWFKREGERVRKGEALVEITTDKAAIEMEAPRAGVVRRILAREKSIVPVGYVLALLGGPDDELPDVEKANRRVLQRHRAAAAAAPQATRPGSRGRAGAVRATPAARRLAREHGLDLAALRKQVKGEVITETAVREFLGRNG